MKKLPTEIIAIYLILLAILSLFMINYTGTFAVLITGTQLLLSYYFYRQTKRRIAFCFFLGACLAIGGGIFHIYWINTTFQILTGLIGFYLLTLATKQSTRFRIIGNSAFGVIFGIVFLPLAITAMTPVPFITILQQYSLPEEASLTEFAAAELDNGGILYKNIDYKSASPFGYLDIYKGHESNAPVFFYVHGGGYSAGDKVEEDLQGKKAHVPWYFDQIMEAGYNIVSINYALAPRHPYPTAFHQLSEAVSFIEASGKQYGITPHTYVFSGSSAGGNLVGQFVNLQTNADYADALKMTPVLEKPQIQAVVFNSALLDNSRFGKSNNGSLALDYFWFQEGKAYLKLDELDERNAVIRETNVISHVTKDFPPAYISDANTKSFIDQAKDLHQRLNALNVYNQFFHISRSDGITSHGYETTNTKYGRQNMEQLQLFLKARENDSQRSL